MTRWIWLSVFGSVSVALVTVSLAAAAAAQVVSLEIVGSHGLPGGEASFEVIFRSGGAEVAGLQNDIRFDPSAPILQTPSGAPDCRVNPAIDKPASAFAFHPPGCYWPSGGCKQVRAAIFSLVNVDPVPDGASLYTCRVRIPEYAAPADSYVLLCSKAIAGTAQGDELETLCSFGEILLPEATPLPADAAPPTHRPTHTRTPTATWDMRTPTHTPFRYFPNVEGGEQGTGSTGGGCQVGPPPAGSAWLGLLAGALLLAGSRRGRATGGRKCVTRAKPG